MANLILILEATKMLRRNCCKDFTSEEFAQIGSSFLGHWSAVDGVNIEFLWIGAILAGD